MKKPFKGMTRDGKVLTRLIMQDPRPNHVYNFTPLSGRLLRTLQRKGVLRRHPNARTRKLFVKGPAA